MGTVDNHVDDYGGNFSSPELCTKIKSYAARIGTSTPQGIHRIFHDLEGKQGKLQTYCYY